MPPTPLLPTSYLAALRTHPRLPPHCWYYIAGVTLSVLNRPAEIGGVLQYALEHGGAGSPSSSGTISHDEQLKIARRMREGLVKSSAVVGLPKTINALLSLKTSTPPALLDPPMTPHPLTTAAPTLLPRALDLATTPSSLILHRGAQLFSTLYGKVAARVMGQMDRCGTEDLGLAARVGYGYILSGGGGTLVGAETSWVLLAALVPQDVNPQLKGHLRGAVNVGGSVEEVRAVREVCVGICERAGMRVLGGEEAPGWGWSEEVAGI